MAKNSNCPIIGCDRPRKRGGVMCTEHWNMVSADLQAAIMSWADMPFSRGYVACVNRAINAVNRRIDDALNLQALTLKVTVRYTAGTYIARGGGKTASCTAGAFQAVCRLARKLLPHATDIPIRCIGESDADRTTWEITLPVKEPHHAA